MSLFTLVSFRQFFRDIMRQKMRTVLTIVGIFWGTISVVLLFAVGKGLHESVLEGSKGLGDRISIVWPGVTSKPWNGMPPGRRIRYTEDDVRMIQERNDKISAISAEYQSSSFIIRYKTNTASGSMSGVWPEFHEMRSILPRAGGRFINELDMTNKRRVAFVGNDLAEKLFGQNIDAGIGEQIFINQMPFIVVGIMQDKEQHSSYSGRDKDKVFIPSTTFKAMNDRPYPSNFVFQAKVGVPMDDAIAGVHEVMASKYAYDPTDLRALSIWDTTQGSEFWELFFLSFRAFLVIIGCFTLITGGIGVANIMHVVVQERTKEIGIKIALGAHKKMVLMQFLAEGLTLVILGGALGFLVAYGMITGIPPALKSMGQDITEYIGTPSIDTLGVVLTVTILGLIGLFAGFFPAKRASNMQPVQAIKLF